MTRARRRGAALGAAVLVLLATVLWWRSRDHVVAPGQGFGHKVANQGFGRI